MELKQKNGKIDKHCNRICAECINYFTTEEAKNLAISNWNEKVNYKIKEVKE